MRGGGDGGRGRDGARFSSCQRRELKSLSQPRRLVEGQRNSKTPREVTVPAVTEPGPEERGASISHRGAEPSVSGPSAADTAWLTSNTNPLFLSERNKITHGCSSRCATGSVIPPRLAPKSWKLRGTVLRPLKGDAAQGALYCTQDTIKKVIRPGTD